MIKISKYLFVLAINTLFYNFVKGDNPLINLNSLQDQMQCNRLEAEEYICKINNNCTYGQLVHFPCEVKNLVPCIGNRSVKIEFQCRYCYLTIPNEEHTCVQENTSCQAISTPRQQVKGSCTTKPHVFCMGNRTFSKMVPCNWTSGFSWHVAFVLSVTVGGFGIDRFYLGHWREGLGKLFSFGGLGVWTLIDVALIGTGYVAPADGSLYIY